MKKILAWALLILYLNAAAQALLPWVSDALAHVFNWQDHLEHVHNGHVHSHHVGFEMAELEKDQTDHPATNHTFFDLKNALSAHVFQAMVVLRDIIPSNWLSLYPNCTLDYKNVIGEVILPPPDALPSDMLDVI